MVEIEYSDGINLWPFIYWSPGRRLHLLWPFITWSVSGGRQVFAIFYFVFRRTIEVSSGVRQIDIFWPIFHFKSGGNGTKSSFCIRPIFWYEKDENYLYMNLCWIFYYKRKGSDTYYHLLPFIYCWKKSDFERDLYFPIYYRYKKNDEEYSWFLLIYRVKTLNYSSFFLVPIYYRYYNSTQDLTITQIILYRRVTSPHLKKTQIWPLIFFRTEYLNDGEHHYSLIIPIIYKVDTPNHITLIWFFGYLSFDKDDTTFTLLLIPVIYYSRNPRSNFLVLCLVYWNSVEGSEGWKLILPIFYRSYSDNREEKLILLLLYMSEEKIGENRNEKFFFIPLYYFWKERNNGVIETTKLIIPFFYTFRTSNKTQKTTWLLLYYHDSLVNEYFYTCFFPIYWNIKKNIGKSNEESKFWIFPIYFSEKTVRQHTYGIFNFYFLSYVITFEIESEDKREYVSKDFRFLYTIIRFYNHINGSYISMILPIYYRRKEPESEFSYICLLYWYSSKTKEGENETWTLILPIHYSVKNDEFCFSFWVPLYYREEFPNQSSFLIFLTYFSSLDFATNDRTYGVAPLFFIVSKGDGSRSLYTPIYIHKTSESSDYTLILFGLYISSQHTTETLEYRSKLVFPFYYTSVQKEQPTGQTFQVSKSFTYCCLLYWYWDTQKSETDTDGWLILFPIYFKYTFSSGSLSSSSDCYLLYPIFNWYESLVINENTVSGVVTRSETKGFNFCVILFRSNRNLKSPVDAPRDNSGELSVHYFSFPLFEYVDNPRNKEFLLLLGLYGSTFNFTTEISQSNSVAVKKRWLFPIVWRSQKFENLETLNVVDGNVISSSWNLIWIVPNLLTIVKYKTTSNFSRFFIFPIYYRDKNLPSGASEIAYVWIFAPYCALYYSMKREGSSLKYVPFIFWLEIENSYREFNLIWIIPRYITIYRNSIKGSENRHYIFPLFYKYSDNTKRDLCFIWIITRWFSFFRTETHFQKNSNDEEEVFSKTIRMTFVFYYRTQKDPNETLISLIWFFTPKITIINLINSTKRQKSRTKFFIFPIYYNYVKYNNEEQMEKTIKSMFWFYPKYHISLIFYKKEQGKSDFFIFPIYSREYYESTNTLHQACIWIVRPYFSFIYRIKSDTLNRFSIFILYRYESDGTNEKYSLFWFISPKWAFIYSNFESNGNQTIWVWPILYSKVSGNTKIHSFIWIFSPSLSLIYSEIKESRSFQRILIIYYHIEDPNKIMNSYFWIVSPKISLVKSKSYKNSPKMKFRFFPILYIKIDEKDWLSFAIAYFFKPKYSLIGYWRSEQETKVYLIPVFWQHEIHTVFDKKAYFFFGLIYLRHKVDSYHLRVIYRLFRYKTGNNGRVDKTVIELNPLFQYKSESGNVERSSFNILGGFIGSINENGRHKFKAFWCCVC